MKNIVAINVSPRKRGTSVMLLEKLKNDLEKLGDHVHRIDLYSHLKEMQVVFDAVSAADTLVICGPCYVNTYPADTTMLLEELDARPDVLHRQNLYGIIQGGMPYAHTHISGLNMLKVFSNKVGLTYQGGFVMGLGALLNGQPLDKLPNGRKVDKQLTVFFGNIHNGEKSLDSVYETALVKMPWFMTAVLAAMMNRKIDKIFAARGMDAHEPSPYLDDFTKDAVWDSHNLRVPLDNSIIS